MDAARASADLFGRACRLPLAIWILERDKPRIYQSGTSARGRRAKRRAARACSARGAGLLDEERPDAESCVYYIRTDSPLWAIIRSAVEVLDSSVSCHRTSEATAHQRRMRPWATCG